MSAATDSTSGDRSINVTRAPSPAASIATCLPMPWVAPVTTMLLCAKRDAELIYAPQMERISRNGNSWERHAYRGDVHVLCRQWALRHKGRRQHCSRSMPYQADDVV